MWKAIAAALSLAAAPAAAADLTGPESLAWSMRALLGGEALAMADCVLGAPICAYLERLEALRKAEPSLIRGDVRVLPNSHAPQVLAVARRLPEGPRAPFLDTIIVFNSTSHPIDTVVMVDPRIDVAKSLWGRCDMPSPGGVLPLKLQPYETLVCAGAVAVN